MHHASAAAPATAARLRFVISVRTHVPALLLLLLPLLALLPATRAPAQQIAFQPTAPKRVEVETIPGLGVNLSPINDWSSEWSLVDAFKASRAWISGTATTWDDQGPIDLDQHGWVKSLFPNQVVRTLMHTDPAVPYPAGDYVVLYDGKGTLSYRLGATKVPGQSKPGRDVVRVGTGNRTIALEILATDPSDYVRNIRVLMPGFESTYQQSLLHPDFVQSLRIYQCLRFMEWQHINESQERTWADRPQLTDARWSGGRGVPLEIICELCNAVDADAWICVPHLADDEYVRQMARLVNARLAPHLRVWLEYTNEAWHTLWAQGRHAEAQGLAQKLSTNPAEARLRWYSQRAVEVLGVWERELNGARKTVRVLSSQAASPWTGRTVMDWNKAYEHADVLAIAPYFGSGFGAPEAQAMVEKLTVDQLLDLLEVHDLPRVEKSHFVPNAAAANERGLQLVGSEGGQSLWGFGGAEKNPLIAALFTGANRHPRMRALYDSYLERWKRSNGGLMVHYVHCSKYAGAGCWGALEHLAQLFAQSPKYQALATWAAANPPQR